MKRLILLGSTAILTACSAGTAPTTDSDTMAAGGTVTVCPDEMILALEDYPEQALPTVSEFDIWHAENGEREGVVTTRTGLQYSVIQPGIDGGVSPQPYEETFAHYHGFFPSGEVFDSSYERGSPFVTPPSRVIKGWTEALTDMKVCEARTLYIPANLAYGNGGGGRPSGTLMFHMQVLRVNTG
jgi:FKBP-type peptidyl-prolyl cis-trans isomerase